MILINNQEIIEVTNTSSLDEVFQSYEFCFSDIPFVEILREDNHSYKCIIGYINIKSKENISNFSAWLVGYHWLLDYHSGTINFVNDIDFSHIYIRKKNSLDIP